jgi:hypothetical protein
MKQNPYRSLNENYDRTGVSCCLPQDVHDIRALCEVYRVPKRRINERVFLANLGTKKGRKKCSPTPTNCRAILKHMEWCYAKLGTRQPASLSRYTWRGRQKEKRLAIGKRGKEDYRISKELLITRRSQKLKVRAGFNGAFCGNPFLINLQNASHVSINHF